MTIIPLSDFAAHLRDGAWLDMRVIDVGTLKRVQIKEIIVRRDCDLLRIVQQWYDQQVEQGMERSLSFDSEHVRWCHVTKWELLDVTLPSIMASSTQDTPSVVSALFKDVTHAVSIIFRATRSDIRKIEVKDQETTRARYAAIVLLYGMTNESPLDVCKVFGYHSQTPWVSACDEFFEGKWRKQLNAAAELIYTRLGIHPRRTRQWSPNAPVFA